jgi:16S rRNA (guanine527-N7)-methyltransferase
MPRGAEESIRRGLQEAGVVPETSLALSEYGALLLEANERSNLTGARTPEAVLSHLIDSLTVLPYVVDPLIDVGSGSGLPAIPLAIAARVPVTMIESSRRKARFLEMVIRTLGLRAHVVAERAEVAARIEALRDRFASGTARAVAGITVTAELLLPFIAPGGLAVFQRGKTSEEDRAALADSALVLSAELESVVPLGGDRRLCLLRKTGPTPQRFPRRTGIPEKRPLCA